MIDPMTHDKIKANAGAILAVVQQLAKMPGMTWVDASKAIYRPRGPFWCLFPTAAGRAEYGKTKTFFR